MNKPVAWFLPVGLLLAAWVAPARAEEEEAEKVYRLVHASAVGIETLEGSGSGLVIAASGLILTNAHVVLTPLPLSVRVEGEVRGQLEEKVFLQVELVGVHPEYDLALLRIDPAEHSMRLLPAKICTEKLAPGRRVYAIGNPGSGGVTLAKTITSGMLSAVDRAMDGLPYHQFSAPINPGNSGGPLCDKNGEVIGLVTFKLREAEGLGFAIPLARLDVNVFASIATRRRDPEKAVEYHQIGSQYFKAADEIARTRGREHPMCTANLLMSLAAFHRALLEDPYHPGHYFNLGLNWAYLQEPVIALAYLARSIDLDPWEPGDGGGYRQAMIALEKLGRRAEAVVLLREAARKFPRSGKLWEDLAINHAAEGSFAEAAYAAEVGLFLGDVRVDEVRRLLDHAKKQMGEDGLNRLRERTYGIAAQLERAALDAAASRERKVRYFDPAVETVVRSVVGNQTLGAPAQGAEPEAPPKPVTDFAPEPAPEAKPPADPPEAKPEPEPEPLTPAQQTARMIAMRLEAARLNHKAGDVERARERLREILQDYPDAPEAAEARKLLEEWK